MTRRRLTKTEQALWEKVARTATPLNPRKLPEALAPSVERPRASKPEPRTPVNGHPAKPPLPSVQTALPEKPLAMDKRAYLKMRRGKLKPEGRIDLHGMTLAQAHPALVAFILRAQGSGKRLVLVITGKGRSSSVDGPIPMRRGLLKTQVPHWLSIPPLAQAVLEVSEAHQSHGGGGAYYVYLRRPR